MTTQPYLPSIDLLESQLAACTEALAAYRKSLDTSNSISSNTSPSSTSVQHLRHLATAARNLQNTATPPQAAFSAIRNGGSTAGILRLGLVLGIFDHVSETESVTVTQLATKTGAAEEFLSRVGRALVALGVLAESTDGKRDSSPETAYIATPLGAWISANKTAQIAMEYIYDVHVGALASMGDYISKFGRKSPHDILNCPVVFAQGAQDIDYFGQMRKRPERVEKFEKCMYAMNEASFADMAGCYEFGSLAVPGDIEEGVVFVDVGGGNGRMLKRLRERFPNMKGKAVLQDLNWVVGKGTVVDGMEDVEVMAYDFFAGEQPVKGAAAYFHQHIFHDWDDESCRRILRNLRPSMAPYSKLLLSEMIIDDHNAPLSKCIDDVTIMVISGRERSRSEWMALLTSEGFKVVAFYGEGNYVNGVIEAVRDGA